MFAMLGDVRFELLGSFTDLEETHAAAYAKHEVLAGRPRLQAMGNDLTQIRFGIKLHWKLGDVDAAYKGLIAAKDLTVYVPVIPAKPQPDSPRADVAAGLCRRAGSSRHYVRPGKQRARYLGND